MDSVKGGFDIAVRTDSRYVVRVRDDMADFAATAALAAGRNVAVVSDDVVDALYGDAVAAQFVGKSVLRVVIPHGEAHKAPAEYVSILNRLAEAGFTREDTVVALGGGVVGDLAGFAAATYMRGVRLIAVPTSLLAMVDSSVGGKTAINIDYGKNLCGAFYQPAEVYINTGFLSTLPPREMLCGWGEIIKYAFIDHTIGMTDLEGDVTPLLIAKCVQCKADVVSADEREGGLRKVLNLGHTVATPSSDCPIFPFRTANAWSRAWPPFWRCPASTTACPTRPTVALWPFCPSRDTTFPTPTRPWRSSRNLSTTKRAERKGWIWY